MSKRVAQLTSAHSPLDTRIFHRQCRSLAEAGYEVVLVAPAEDDAVLDGVRLRAVPPPNTRRARMTRTVRAVLRVALEEDADLYHFHDPELIPVGIRLKLAGKRVLYDLHEDLPRQILDKHWIRPVLRRAVANAAVLAETMAARAFDGLVAATPVIAARFPPAKTVMVQNFPEFEELTAPDALPYRRRGREMAYVGNLTTTRGVHEMLEAMRGLENGSEATLLIAGEFSPPELQAECARHPAWSRVRYFGVQPRRGVAQLLARARAGLALYHPVQHYVESQPVKMFEYMAAGIPVIVSDFPLFRDIVEGARCGLLVDPLQPRAIADAIRWVLDHSDEAETMGQAGQTAVKSRYGWPSEANKLLTLYSRVLNGAAA